MKRIFLIGAHGHNNYGDDLILDSFLQRFKNYPCTVTAFEPKDIRHITNVYNNCESIVPTYSFSRIWIYQFLIASTVVFGGGDIIRELRYTKAGISVSTMISTCVLVLVSKLLCKRVIFTHIGIGSIESINGFRLLHFLLKCSSFTALRDVKSYRLCSKYSDVNTQLTSDVVFSNKVIQSFSHITEKNKDAGHIVCSFRALHNKEKMEQFLDDTFDKISILIAKNMCFKITFVSFQLDQQHNDSMDVAPLQRKLQQTYPELPIAVVETRDITEIHAIYSSASVLWGARLHSLILATMWGLPFIAFSYDNKITKYARQVGMMDYFVDMYAPSKGDDIKKTHSEIYKKYNNISKRLLTYSQEQSLAQEKIWKQIHNKV